MAELTKTDRLVLEIQQLALDLYELRRSKGLGCTLSDAELSRQSKELADTMTRKMLVVGPMRTESGISIRPTGEFYEVVGIPGDSYFVAGIFSRREPYGWLYALSRATPWPAEEHEQAAIHALFYEPTPDELVRAQERWNRAESSLFEEGWLPVSTTRPSAAGRDINLNHTCLMTTRQLNRLRRNERIRRAFRQRYIDVPRPRKLSREFVLAQLADDFCLSVATIEDIVYTSPTEE